MKTYEGKWAIAALSLALASAAVDAAGPGPMPFTAMDTDQNGQVSEQEYLTARAQHQQAMAAQGRLLRNAASAPKFADWDTNKDGQLSPEEFAAGRLARMQQRWGDQTVGLQPSGWATGRGMGRGMGPCWR